MLFRLIRWLNEGPSEPYLKDWFSVHYDQTKVELAANPPRRRAWSQSFEWSTVERVCFKDEGLEASDVLYVFTSLRPESFVIPVEAKGGDEFFNELVSRGLFPAQLMKEAALSIDGRHYCWPPTVNEKTDA